MSPGIRFDHGAETRFDAAECRDEGHSMEMPLAVVGFSLKFPQEAISAEAFWSMMMEGRCAMTEFPGDRLNIESFHDPSPSKRDTV